MHDQSYWKRENVQLHSVDLVSGLQWLNLGTHILKNAAIILNDSFMHSSIIFDGFSADLSVNTSSYKLVLIDKLKSNFVNV